MTGRRLVTWVALLVATVALLTVAAVDGGGVETDTERIQRLSDSFACPQCQGEAVSESNAAVAANIRDVIRTRVGQGRSDQEIRDELVAGYGSRVLLRPPADGIASLLWVLPVVFAVGAAASVAAMVGRRRDTELGGPSEDDRALVDAARQRRRSDVDADGDGDGDGDAP